ncbi:MAG: hypothetical protein MUC76_08260 [Spirochaetes bacterium]|nr:hypothetical protein [Spirochaetota bacterium]
MFPPLLRKLFVLHFALDYLFAIPLMIAPVRTMALFGWDNAEPVATRLVAAALLGIGGVSLIARNADAASYRHMLTMKLLWSGAAVLGLLISLFEGAPVMTAGFLAVFASFFGVWLYYRLRLKIV